MEHAAIRRVLRRRSHRELVAIRFPGDQRAGGFELRHRGRFVRRAIAFQNARAARRRELQRADVVLHRDRHAVEHAGRTGRGGLSVERLAEILGRGEQRVEALRFHQAVGDRFGITHSNWPSFGTTKKPSLKSGANSSGPNASWAGVTSSVRKRMASGPGTTGFTLPFAGTALSCAT